MHFRALKHTSKYIHAHYLIIMRLTCIQKYPWHLSVVECQIVFQVKIPEDIADSQYCTAESNTTFKAIKLQE